MHQQLYKTTGDTSLNDSLNFIVGSIGEVGNGPASIDENFVIQRVDKFGKHGKCWLDLWVGDLKVRMLLLKSSDWGRNLQSASQAVGSFHGRNCSGSR